MSMIYSVVARNGQILVRAGDTSGNIPSIVNDLLERIPSETDDRRTFTADRTCFHYIVSQRVIFLVVADEQFGAIKPFHYLQTLQNEWTRYYGSRSGTISAEVASIDFSRKMETMMGIVPSGFGTPSSSSRGPKDKIEMVSRQIEDVKQQMVSNLDSVLARGEKIETLVETTSNLNTNAATFRKTAVSLKRHMWWKNAKCWIIMGVLLLVIAFIIALVVCKGNFKTCGRKSNPTKPPSPSPGPVPHPPPSTTPISPPPNATPPPIPPPVAPTPVNTPIAMPPTPVIAPTPVVVPTPVNIPIHAPSTVIVPEDPPVSIPVDPIPVDSPFDAEPTVSAPMFDIPEPAIESPSNAPVSPPPVLPPQVFPPFDIPPGILVPNNFNILRSPIQILLGWISKLIPVQLN